MTAAVIDGRGDRLVVVGAGAELVAPLAAFAASAADRAEAAALASEAASITSALSIDGDQLPRALRIEPQYFNGAVARLDSQSRALGLTTPSGQTGKDSLVSVAIPIEGTELAGVDIGLVYLIDTSATYDRALGMTLLVKTTTGNIEARVSSEYQYDTTPPTLTMGRRYTMQGDEVELIAFVQQTATTATSAQQWMMIAGISVRVLTAEGLQSPNDIATSITRQRDFGRIIEAVQSLTPIVVTVKPSGGDYTSPAAALAAITDASAGKPYLVKIWPSAAGDKSWPCNELTMKAHVGLEGVGPAQVWLKGYQPADSAPGNAGPITQNSTVRWDVGASMKNIRVTAQNMRYAIHADNPPMSYATLVTENCTFEHLGNAEARAYQISQGHSATEVDTFGSPYYVWRSVSAWGSGTWPGGRMVHRATLFRSASTPYLAHNTNDSRTNPPTAPLPQDDPATILLDACTIVATDGASAFAVQLQSFGTGQTDECQIVGCALTGTVEMSIQRGAENNWLVTGHGNVGLAFTGAAIREVVTDA